MDEEQMEQLKKNHIKTDEQWGQFQSFFRKLPAHDHPTVRKPSVCKGILLSSLAFIVLLGLLYVFFIILQLALFNLIMLVVMAVWWWKLFKIANAVITRVLDNGRKAPFKAFIREMKALEWLKSTNIEIQEQEEGKWIEIHLNETESDNIDDLNEIVDEDDDWTLFIK